MKLPHIPFTVLDTETTGFLPRVNRIIEFASARMEKGKVVDEYEQLVAPDCDIPFVVQVLTHIRPQMLEGKPTLKDITQELLKRIGSDTLIVGQNTSFDLKMLKGEGIDLTERAWVDTSMLASLVFPELASYSLGYVSAMLGLRHDPVHRALGDVHATLELFSRCWERLLELPEDMLEEAKDVMSRSSPGYQRLFEALPDPTKKQRPKWLVSPAPTREQGTGNRKQVALEKPDVGKVDLLEEPLDPTFLSDVIVAAVEDRTTIHWIAVKNLEATVRRMTPPEGIRVLYPPFLLVDPDAASTLHSQKEFTADEATLALKLSWYRAQTRADLPIHGEERAVWDGKLAATEKSDVYTAQFRGLPGVVLLDQRQLLEFLSDPEHGAHSALKGNVPRGSSSGALQGTHIIIDDASLLEDTATNAYGWPCSLDALRAASEGNTDLTKFTDLVQLWVEKMRAFQDTHMLTREDLGAKESKGLRERMSDLLESPLPSNVQRMFENLQRILDPENLPGRLTWVETRTDGTQFIESVPERISEILRDTLYTQYPTTLLIPPGSAETLTEILPRGVQTALRTTNYTLRTLPIAFSIDTTLDSLLEHPPQGKTVVLFSSRRPIEDAFVRHTEKLEKEGVTLICQNLSGGRDRMQAEFVAAKAPAVWLLTPWTYEGVELPEETCDHLVIANLPFDHPDDIVRKARAAHYRSGFGEYAFPRVIHRLFRILRTYCRHSARHGDVLFLDPRLQTKDYGKEIWRYLEQFQTGADVPVHRNGQLTMF